MRKLLYSIILIIAAVSLNSFTSKESSAFNALPPEIGINIGDQAPEIVMKGIDGVELRLSNLRGKLVLIHFWASWDAKSRRDNRSYVETYEKYRNVKFNAAEGFEIFSVSLDQKKDSWEKAIAKDGLFWKSHVNDFKGSANAAGGLYELQSTPSTWLIDENGIILARNLHVEYLNSELDKYLR